MGFTIPILGLLGAVMPVKTQTVLLGDALFSKTQQKILGLLFSKPEQSHFTNEIVRWAGVGKGTITRELESMLAAGLITLTQMGNQKHYQANAQCPIYHELVAIVRKTFGVSHIIRAALLPLATQISSAFIYGAIAKDEASAESEIDLMVVGEGINYNQIMELLKPVEINLSRNFNPTIYSQQVFNVKHAAANPFLLQVLGQARVSIIGESP
jgi:uncharacterized protein